MCITFKHQCPSGIINIVVNVEVGDILPHRCVYCCPIIINNKFQQLNGFLQQQVHPSTLRLAYELEVSRKIALERELEYSRALEIQRLADAKQLQYRQIKEVQRLQEEQEFRNYQLRKNAQLIEAEDNLLRERLLREEKQKEYHVFV